MSIADNKGKRYGLGGGLNRKEGPVAQMLRPLNLGLENKHLTRKSGRSRADRRQALSLLMSTMTPIEFLILDEHTAALDPKTAEIIMELTDQIVKRKKLTTIMVTHSLRYAVEYETG